MLKKINSLTAKKVFLLGLLLLTSSSFAAASIHSGDHDPVSSVIFWVTVLFGLAIVGRCLAQRLHQPGVLGELLIGVLLGNICYLLGSQLIIVLREGGAIFSIMRDMLTGIPLQRAVNASINNTEYANQVMDALSSKQGIEYLKVGYVLDIFSRYGVMFLLFMVGLESSLTEMRKTGRQALQVALIGVIAPILLGFSAAHWLAPAASFHADLFVAATLSATSIGITARVLAELKKLQSREANTILGAAMIDDVLGLIILALVSSLVISNHLEWFVVLKVLVSALLFFALSFTLGPWLLRKSRMWFNFLEFHEAKLFIAFLFLMGLAWLATVMQLASIIGAFAAGVIIHDDYFENQKESKSFDIHELIFPLEFLFAPLFFILIGIQVKLESFLDTQVLLMASGLTIAAIIGKLLSGLGASKQDDRLLVGLGMLPRGEVGLVFASIGRTLGVISDQLFSAIVLMIIITTVLTPPLLKIRYNFLDKKMAKK